MRITSQMLAANQLKAGIEPSSKTLLDYIQNDDNDSLTSLLSKKTDTSTSSLTKKLQKDAYKNIKDDADSVTENAAERTGDYSAIYADIKSVVDSYNKLYNTLGKTSSSINTMCSDLLKEAVKENSETLSAVGIALKDDGSLSIDEKKLKAADTDTLKKAFGTSSEFAKRLGIIGSNVSSLAKANINYVTNSYTSSGAASNSSDDLYSLMTSKFNSRG